jgi:hypothetical protein
LGRRDENGGTARLWDEETTGWVLLDAKETNVRERLRHKKTTSVARLEDEDTNVLERLGTR